MRSIMFPCTCPAKLLGEPSSPHKSLSEDRHLLCLLNLAVVNLVVARHLKVPTEGKAMGLLPAVRGPIGKSVFWAPNGQQMALGCSNKQQDGGWRLASRKFLKFAKLSRWSEITSHHYRPTVVSLALKAGLSANTVMNATYHVPLGFRGSTAVNSYRIQCDVQGHDVLPDL